MQIVQGFALLELTFGNRLPQTENYDSWSVEVVAENDLYFEPGYEEFKPRAIWSLSSAFTSAFKKLDPIPQFLRGHIKSGQRWSLQNRPTEVGLGLGCFTPPPPEEASLFSCANSVDHI